MRPAAAVLLLGLASCTLSVKPGESRASLEESGALRYALYEYERDGVRHVLIPTWHGGGLLGISSSLAAPNRDISLLRFENGRLKSVEDLGRDRDRWIARLREDEAGFGEEDDELIVRRQVAEGMKLPAVLLAWGPPNGPPDTNPRYYRPTREIATRGEELLWYSWAEGRLWDTVAWSSVILKDGQVQSVRSEGPGLPRVAPRRPAQPSEPAPVLSKP